MAKWRKRKFKSYPIGYFHVDIAIEHHLTKVNHPWPHGQVERVNCTLKEATVKKSYYQTRQNLEEHLQTVLMAYNFAKKLQTLKGLAPYQLICAAWQKNLNRFTLNLFRHTPGTKHLAQDCFMCLFGTTKVAP